MFRGSKKKSSGFTLVEVMVALLVVVTAITALLTRMMANVDSTAYLRDKTVAQWVAMNQLVEARLVNQRTNQLIRSETNGKERLGGRDWYWRIKPEQTKAEGYQRLVIEVRDSLEDEAALVAVKGLIDRFHKP